MAAGTLPKMKLWYCPMLRSTRCIWLVKELGIEEAVEYKYVPIGPPPPASEREEYRKVVHPHGTVPALEVEGRPPVLESAAICMYLADLCGRLAPEPKDRAEYYNWILYCSSRLDEAMTALALQWMFTPKDQQKQEVITKYLSVANICLDNAERALEDRQFILGPELTAADCVLGYNVVWASVPHMNGGQLLKGRPNLTAYLGRIQARPALKEALAIEKL
ncbi:glutathione S-transferase GstA-like [Littorina saxatilis]|uniref:Glutathione S-transferase n=1 Tax=Littorina saxatilis TaxID=31220 RepID=A0AAN9GLJ1_9CAEN